MACVLAAIVFVRHESATAAATSKPRMSPHAATRLAAQAYEPDVRLVLQSLHRLAELPDRTVLTPLEVDLLSR